MSSLLLYAIFLKICILFNHSWNSNFIIKIQKDSLFVHFVLNALFIIVYHVEAVQDDISAKTVPVWLHITVVPVSGAPGVGPVDEGEGPRDPVRAEERNNILQSMIYHSFGF